MVIGTIVSCSNDESTIETNELNGSWKLQKIQAFSGEVYTTNEDVIYHFNNDMNLVIESNISENGEFENFVSSQTIPYVFYFDSICFESQVVRLGNDPNTFGSFYCSKMGNVLILSEYDGNLLTFVKIQ